MDIESTNTLEVLCIGESVTEVEETVYGKTPELIEAAELLGPLMNTENTGAHRAIIGALETLND